MSDNKTSMLRRGRGETTAQTCALMLTLAVVGATFGAPAAANASAGTDCGARAVAHRGGHDTADENTVRSVHRAAQLGAHVELDLRVIQADHSLAFMHDGNVRRTTNGEGQLEEMTQAQVKRLRTEPHGGRVMFWRGFLEAMLDHPRLVALVEAKQFAEYWSGNVDVFQRIEDTLLRTGLADRVYLGGMAGFMFSMAREAPQVKTFWEVARARPFTVQEITDHSANMAFARPRKLDASVARQMRGQSIRVFARLSQQPEQWKTAVNRGATGVLTDRVSAFNTWCARFVRSAD